MKRLLCLLLGHRLVYVGCLRDVASIHGDQWPQGNSEFACTRCGRRFR